MTRRLAGLGARPETWLGLLLVWVTVSALRSSHTPWEKAALTEWLRWGAGLGLFLSLGRWLTRPRLAARLLVVCTGVITLIGISSGLVQARGGLIGPFRDHQLCGSALLALLPLTLAVALTARETRWRWGAQVAGMAGLVCLVMTEARSAWFGAAMAGLVFAVFWWRRTGIASGRRQARQLLVPVLLIVGVGATFTAFVGQSELQKPLTHRAGTLGALDQDSSWQTRLRTWRGAERMAAAAPVFGWGLGRYPGIQWQFTHVGRPLTPAQRPSLSEQAHDLYLQTMAEIGLVGLALLLLGFGVLAWRSLDALRQGQGRPIRSRDGFLVATLASLAGLMVDGVASPSYQFAEVSLFVWAALGVGLAALNRADVVEAEVVRLPVPLLRVTRLATAGALSLCLLSQFIPLGLLTPVEAYTPPAGWVFSGVQVLCDQDSLSPGGTATFRLMATYTVNGVAQPPVDVTFDNEGVPAYFAVATGGVSAATKFGTGDTRNVLTVSPYESKTSLTLRGTFSSRVNGIFTHPANNLTLPVNSG